MTTVNVDFLVNAIDDPDVMSLLQQADLNLADGMPLLWASRLLRTPLPERVAGADLVPRLAEASATRGWKIHLFGAGPGVAQRARDTMLEAHPDGRITADSGPASVDVRRSRIDDVVEAIRAVDPDVLCVALGNPKQERFIATYRNHLECPVMIGIGGSLDMLIGDKQRAPQWAQRVGAEWLFRAAQEPKRLGRRYAHDITVFGPHLATYVRDVRGYRDAQSLAGHRHPPHELHIAVASDDREWPPFDIAHYGHRASRHRPRRRDGPDACGLTRDCWPCFAKRRMLGIPTRVSNVSDPLRTCFDQYRTWSLLAEILTES